MNTTASSHQTPTLFAALRRFWWMVLGFAVFGAGLGFVASGLQPTKYEASARILVDQAQNQGLGGEPAPSAAVRVDPIRRLLNEVERMRSPEVLQPAAAKLGGALGTAELLAPHVSASSAPELDLLRVTGSAPTADEAARIANAVVESYTALVIGERQTAIERSITLQVDLNKRLQGEIDQLNGRLLTIQQDTTIAVQRVQRIPALVIEDVGRRLSSNPEYQQLTAQRNALIEAININARKIEDQRIVAQLARSGINVFDAARPPLEPVQPKPTRNAALAAVFGLLAGAGIAWWQADRLAPAGTSGAAEVLGAPELGELPAARSRSRRQPVDLGPSSPVAAGGRLVAAALSYRMPSGEGRTVLVTGLHHSSGRTLTVLAVATAVARTGRKVLVVDADPGVGGLSKLFSPQSRRGLDDLVRGLVSPHDVVTPVDLSGIDGIDLLPAGSAPLEFIAQGAAEDARAELAATAAGYDLVLIDAPPLAPSPVALELSRLADALVLVVPADVSAGELARARDRLQLIGARVAGFVTTLHGIDSHPLRIVQAQPAEPEKPYELPVGVVPDRDDGADRGDGADRAEPVEAAKPADDFDLEAIIRRTLSSRAKPAAPDASVGDALADRLRTGTTAVDVGRRPEPEVHQAADDVTPADPAVASHDADEAKPPADQGGARS